MSSAYPVLKSQGLMDRIISLKCGMRQARCYPEKEAVKVKTTIITFFVAALIAAAPVALARNGKTPNQHHQASKNHPRVVSGDAPWHTTHARGLKTGYPGAFGYELQDYTSSSDYFSSRQAGGGGGGGGSGM